MNAIVLANVELATLEILPSAVATRDALLRETQPITSITSEFEQECAVDILRNVRGVLTDLEKCRKEVKKPVLELGRKIDQLADSYAEPLDSEMKRVNAILTRYQVEQQRQAAEAERKRQEEIQRAEAARRKAEADALEAQRAVQRAAEQRMLAESAEQDRAAKLAQVKADELAREQLAAAQQAAAEMRSIQSAVAVPPPRPTGLAVKDVWKFEVLDVHAVYAADRSLVRVEENRSLIARRIADGMTACPGLRIWKETVTEVRR